MFHSLEKGIERTEGQVPSLGDRLIRYLAIILLSALVLGALWLGIVILE